MRVVPPSPTVAPPAAVPRWLLPAAGLWAVLGAVALANATPVPVHGAAVLAVLAVLAVVHGRIHHRWRVAGPVAAVTGAVVAAFLLGLLPAEVDLGYAEGPAADLTPRVVWPLALAITSAEILLARTLHRRAGQAATAGTLAEDPSPDGSLGERQARTRAQIGALLTQLDQRVTEVETRLTTVP